MSHGNRTDSHTAEIESLGGVVFNTARERAGYVRFWREKKEKTEIEKRPRVIQTEKMRCLH